MEYIFAQPTVVQCLPHNEAYYVSIMLDGDNKPEKIAVCLALIPKGIVIDMTYINHSDKFDRLWTLDLDWGRIAYIEIENPELRHYQKFDTNDPSGNAYELHAMPHDLHYLDEVLERLIAAISQQRVVNHQKLSPLIKQLLPPDR